MPKINSQKLSLTLHITFHTTETTYPTATVRDHPPLDQLSPLNGLQHNQRNLGSKQLEIKRVRSPKSAQIAFTNAHEDKQSTYDSKSVIDDTSLFAYYGITFSQKSGSNPYRIRMFNNKVIQIQLNRFKTKNTTKKTKIMRH